MLLPVVSSYDFTDVKPVLTAERAEIPVGRLSVFIGGRGDDFGLYTVLLFLSVQCSYGYSVTYNFGPVEGLYNSYKTKPR